MQTQENKPEKKFRAAAVSATIFPSKATLNGSDVRMKNVVLDRRYKDRNGEWQSSRSLGINDLPKAIVALQRAYEYLVVRDEQEEETPSGSAEVREHGI